MSVPGLWSRLVLHTESSLGFGGQEIRILTEARWLRQHDWDVLVVCQPASRLAAEAHAAGVPAVAVSMGSALDVRALLVLRRLMKARGVRLVHTHSSIDSWLATLAAKSLGLPVVRGRHVTIPIRRYRALVYRLADRIITSGEAVRMLVARAGVPLDRIVAIPAGFDPTRFHPGVSGERVRQELALKGPVVGLVANVRGSKGHHYFLQAAREIVRVRPDARFLIVGDGIGLGEVRRQIEEMQLSSCVIVTGFRRDIPEVIAALDVLVLPSTRSEAVSQVILQALAIGTPVVGTTVGGTPEVVRDGENGRLVPPGDAQALAAAIFALIDDPARARAMARAGAEVHARYALDATMAQTTALYTELLDR